LYSKAVSPLATPDHHNFQTVLTNNETVYKSGVFVSDGFSALAAAKIWCRYRNGHWRELISLENIFP
jgi:hypothetical protein